LEQKKKKKKTNFVPNWQFIVQELKLGSISIQQSMNKNSCNESTFCALDPSFTSTINAISFSLSNLTEMNSMFNVMISKLTHAKDIKTNNDVYCIISQFISTTMFSNLHLYK
jgi:hypothetical protein